MSVPGSSPTPADDNFISQFHVPSFGDEEFQMSTFAVNTDTTDPSTHQQQQQSPQQTQPQETPPAQHQQEHMYSQLVHHQAMAPLPIHLNPLSMSVTECRSSLPNASLPLDSLAPKFPPQNFEVPDISLSNSVTSAEVMEEVVSQVGIVSQPQTVFTSCVTTSADSLILHTSSLPMAPPQQTPRQPVLTMVSQSLQAMKAATSPAASGSHTSSPTRESSEDSDDSLPLAQLVSMKRAASSLTAGTAGVEKPAVKEVSRPAPIPKLTVITSPAKRQRGGKKKKKKDPNEPQKPVSAYALFFRDTQAAIKGQNPVASFGEVSKIVASMWEGLDLKQKEVYKRRTEVAKKEYLKQLAAYRASQVSQSAADEASGAVSVEEKSPSPPSMVHHTNTNTQSSSLNTRVSLHTRHQQHLQQQLQQQQQQQQQQQEQQQQQQEMEQQLQQQQQTMSQNVIQQPYNSPPVSQGEVSVPVYHTNTSPQHRFDPALSSSHDVGLYPQSSVQESSSNMQAMCVRDGCGNVAIDNPAWDAEFCSNQCVVTHCRDIFTAWVAARGGTRS